MSQKNKVNLCLTIILLIALFLRFPLVDSNLPYFYDEDEAHHFNRQVEMLKTGDLNPHYFLKPSFNFYARLSPIATGFFWTVKQGNIKSIQDVKTRDKFGLAGYSFTASHPAILKFNRLFSVLLSLGIVVIVYYLVLAISSKEAALFAALTTAVAPLLVEHSVSVGVNVLTAFLCSLTCLLATLFLKNKNKFLLIFTALAAGLAISTKYNAAPIFLLPILIVFLVRPFKLSYLLIALIATKLGFLIGSPYILAEIPLFLDHVAYEVWHYGVVGHVGHMAEPGLQQAIHYLKNLSLSSFGVIPVLVALIGIVLSLKEKNKQTLPALAFLLVYFALMVSQKANFVRNMILVVPFLSVFAGIAFERFAQYLKPRYLVVPLAFLLLTQPLLSSYFYIQKVEQTDLRNKAYTWLNKEENNFSDLALDGELQLPLFITYSEGKKYLSRKGMKRVRFNENSVKSLFLDGYDEIFFGPQAEITDDDYTLLSMAKVFPGDKEPKRIVKNPAMVHGMIQPKDVFSKQDAIKAILNYVDQNVATLKTKMLGSKCIIDFVEPEEEHFWIKKRITPLDISACRADTLDLKLKTPWPNQRVGLIHDGQLSRFIGFEAGKGIELSLDLKKDKKQIYLVIYKIHSPLTQGISTDDRRLGVALLPAKK